MLCVCLCPAVSMRYTGCAAYWKFDCIAPWWNDTVQQVIKAKKREMKMWETSEGRQAEIATDRKTRR